MKKGMSLIVLVITILVMIILAGVVVVSLSKNNPIETAKTANTLTALSEAQSAVNLYAADKLAKATDGTAELTITDELEGAFIPTLHDQSATPIVTSDDRNQFFKVSANGAKLMDISLPKGSEYYAANKYGKMILVVADKTAREKYNNPSVYSIAK
ncbi:MAG: hypothetical protein RR594_03425 [Clostridia bacterium]